MAYSSNEKGIIKELKKKRGMSSTQKDLDKIKQEFDVLKNANNIILAVVATIGLAVGVGFITLILTTFQDIKSSQLIINDEVKQLQEGRYQLLESKLEILKTETQSTGTAEKE